MEITVQPKELAAGKLSDAHVKQALDAIRVDGYVVLENVVSHEHLDILRERMDADSQTLIKAEKWGGRRQTHRAPSTGTATLCALHFYRHRRESLCCAGDDGAAGSWAL